MSCAIFLNIFFNQNSIWNVHSIKEGEVTFTAVLKRNCFWELTLPLPVPCWAGDNTDLPSNSNISKTVRVKPERVKNKTLYHFPVPYIKPGFMVFISDQSADNNYIFSLFLFWLLTWFFSKEQKIRYPLFISLHFKSSWKLPNDILKWHSSRGWRCHNFQAWCLWRQKEMTLLVLSDLRVGHKYVKNKRFLKNWKKLKNVLEGI